MQSKIIFLLLFVFSLIIVHDTLFASLETDKTEQISNHLEKQKEANQLSSKLHDLHDLFHFVGYITQYKALIYSLKPVKIASYFPDQRTTPYPDLISKPPIV